MYKNKFKFMILAVAVSASILQGCKKDDLPDVEEEELITSISLTFTNTADAADVKTFKSVDLDGDGGNPPQTETIVLTANKTYSLKVSSLLNELENPAEDVLAEVAKEKDEHLFVYRVTGNLTINVIDRDTKNLPIGISSTAVTTGAGTGTLSVELRHQPDGQKNGTATPGSTDILRVFPLTIR